MSKKNARSRQDKGTDSLLQSLSEATDTLGVPLFKDEMKDVWEEQKRHVRCLQDPPGLQLYTVTGYLKKGGINLPVFRCARGSTSLESFHLHIARFIPGTSANAVNFQAYLIEGIVRWNRARAEAAIKNESSTKQHNPRTFDLRLQEKVNLLGQSILGKEVVPLYRPPAAYTGELLGVEYLYHQTGEAFLPKDEDELLNKIDEGFCGELDDDSEGIPSVAPFSEDITTFAILSDKESEVRVSSKNFGLGGKFSVLRV